MVLEKDLIGTELDIRHTFISESLVQLGEQVPLSTKTAIIYPKGHWYGEHNLGGPQTKGILYYLLHAEERTKQFKKYSDEFSKRSAWDDFYRIRNYISTENGWREQDVLTLSSPVE